MEVLEQVKNESDFILMITITLLMQRCPTTQNGLSKLLLVGNLVTLTLRAKITATLTLPSLARKSQNI